MACPRYFQSARFGRAGASRPSLPLQFYLLWFPIKLLSAELLRVHLEEVGSVQRLLIENLCKFFW